jgi:hypothetical protein
LSDQLTNTLIELALARPLDRRHAAGLPTRISTVGEAIAMIAALDRASRASLHWRLASGILEYAQAVKSRRAIELATDAVENALASDGWLSSSASGE